MNASIASSITQRIVAGGHPGDFLTVRHVTASGSNRQIGQTLAIAARAIHGEFAEPRPASSPEVQRARRTWFEAQYPALAERIAGICDAFGVDPTRDDLDLGMLGTYHVPAGCSAVFHPPPRTWDRHCLLGRNFDFPTGGYSEILGQQPGAGERPLAADPWVVELYPDSGYSSITIGIMDVLGAMDGINSAGLAVTLLADDESPNLEPSQTSQVGLSEQQVVRYLLDTCATVDEAKQALLTAKHYYLFVPCHFLVADVTGRAFVWEHSPRRNLERIVDADAGGRMVCTNHLLHRWPDASQLPDDRAGKVAGLTYQRWRALDARVQSDLVVDKQVVREQLADVAFTDPRQSVRTLWCAVYDLHARSVDVSFFCHDLDGTSRYSPVTQLSLPRAHQPESTHVGEIPRRSYVS